MPYRSFKQDAFMHIHHPDIAKRWDAETKKEGLPFPTKAGDKKRKVQLRKPVGK